MEWRLEGEILTIVGRPRVIICRHIPSSSGVTGIRSVRLRGRATVLSIKPLQTSATQCHFPQLFVKSLIIFQPRS